MDKTLLKGEDKIQKICDQLKIETLEPAERQAENIINEAEKKSHHIVHEAEKKAENLIKEAKHEIEKERALFRSSLEQAAKQGMEVLRQDIEKKLFNEQLKSLIDQGTQDPDVVAKIINAIVSAIEKEGIRSDLSAQIPKNVSKEAVNKLLAEKVLQKLENQSVVVGDFFGGAKVKLIDRKMTLDLSDQAIRELIAHFVRKDFRELIFG